MVIGELFSGIHTGRPDIALPYRVSCVGGEPSECD